MHLQKIEPKISSSSFVVLWYSTQTLLVFLISSSYLLAFWYHIKSNGTILEQLPSRYTKPLLENADKSKDYRQNGHWFRKRVPPSQPKKHKLEIIIQEPGFKERIPFVPSFRVTWRGPVPACHLSGYFWVELELAHRMCPANGKVCAALAHHHYVFLSSACQLAPAN